jgi:FtsZ-binding cell division protein ZapB
MDIADRLERSVLKIVEKNKQLREEIENLTEKVNNADSELRKANEIIQNLQNTVEKYKQNDNGYDDFVSKKKIITEHIKGIIKKIDTYETRNTIDRVTNV